MASYLLLFSQHELLVVEYACCIKEKNGTIHVIHQTLLFYPFNVIPKFAIKYKVQLVEFSHVYWVFFSLSKDS